MVAPDLTTDEITAEWRRYLSKKSYISLKGSGAHSSFTCPSAYPSSPASASRNHYNYPNARKLLFGSLYLLQSSLQCTFFTEQLFRTANALELCVNLQKAIFLLQVCALKDTRFSSEQHTSILLIYNFCYSSKLSNGSVLMKAPYYIIAEKAPKSFNIS